jgi:hypothetical protein
MLWLKTLVGKPEGKRPLGRPRRRWVNNIKMNLREIVWAGMDWIGLDLSGAGYGRVEASCEHGNKPAGSIECCEVLE